MLKLHLIRHGQTFYNAESRIQGQFDSVLTEQGIRQAEERRPLVESLGINAIYSSSNVRARHTAEIMTAGLTLDIDCRDNLREIYLGPWQQRLWSDVEESDPQQCEYFMTRPDRFAVEGAETFGELQTRGVAAVEEIIGAEFAVDTKRDVLVVAHGAILKAILARYAEVPLSQMWTEPHLLNCSHSVVEVSDPDCDAVRQVTSISGQSLGGTVWARGSESRV